MAVRMLSWRWIAGAGLLVGVIAVGAWAVQRFEAHDAGVSTAWLAFGWAAQVLFAMRFLVQWLASEKAKHTVIPPAFWWLSLFGGISLTIYCIRRGDPVTTCGQLFPLAIYARNLWMHYLPAAAAEPAGSPAPEARPLPAERMAPQPVGGYERQLETAALAHR